MKIDTAPLAKFGSLVSGGGLSAVFDGVATTSGYATAGSGFAGVSLDTPRRVACVKFSSKADGFDGSGLCSTITAQLYGKAGAAPSSATDGQLIGAMTFTDQNVARSISLESTDKESLFEHVWLRMTTGVWVEVAELEFYEAPEPAPELPLGPGSHVFLTSCNQNVPLTNPEHEVAQFRTRLFLAESRAVLIDFHANVIHTGDGADAGIAVGFSFRIGLRSAANKSDLVALPFIRIPNAVDGGNVSERNPHHYGHASICTAPPAPHRLGPGYHEISVFGDGHTDGSTTQGILKVLAEGGIGLNCLRVVVLP